jgi:hypothetical protein
MKAVEPKIIPLIKGIIFLLHSDLLSREQLYAVSLLSAFAV